MDETKENKIESKLVVHDNQIKQLKDDTKSLDNRVSVTESQIGRISSHIESEIGLARKDITKIDEKLFGKGEDEYGGRFGQFSKRLYKLEMTILSLGGAAAIIIFAIALYTFFMRNLVNK